MDLLSSLQWYWDLSAADASIVDQHNGLSLGKIGTVTTSATGGPDGGPCIDCGGAAGKYRNASVAKTVSYDDGFSVNIWARSTGSSSIFNGLIIHRNVTSNFYFQLQARISDGTDSAATGDTSSTFRIAGVAMAALNVWQMLTMVDTGTETTLYRNGVSVATSSTTLGSRATTAANFAIGGSAWNAFTGDNLNHRGQLAMAGVWNEPLTTGQITALYNSGNGLRYASLPSGTVQTRRRRDLGGFGL